jgi:ankyrin repeat protein
LKKGIKISVKDGKGSTPLHWACYSGMENAAKALIAWGAEINNQ